MFLCFDSLPRLFFFYCLTSFTIKTNCVILEKDNLRLGSIVKPHGNWSRGTKEVYDLEFIYYSCDAGLEVECR